MPAVADADAEESLRESRPSLHAALTGAGIRVRIANPYSPALLHVRAMLAGVRGVFVMTEAGMQPDAPAAGFGADVVIAELATAHLSARAAIRQLIRSVGTTHLLIMSERRDVEWILAALDAGAAGVVPTSASREALIIAVRAIASGQIVLPRRAISALAARVREEVDVSDAHLKVNGNSADTHHSLARLTGRERSVFRMIAEGYSAPEVGARLSISKKTVETYKKRIGEKLGLSHRTDYVRMALLADVLAVPRAVTVE
jgi:DNA-binding NarL/FixJ family response regulator